MNRGYRPPNCVTVRSDQAETHVQPEQYSNRDQSSGTRNAVRVNKRFSNKDQKYSGADDEIFGEFIEQYMAASRDLLLSNDERLKYLHNLFREEALRFYNANANGRASNFSQALSMMKEQFHSMGEQ